jgi:hypothetical protein
LGRPAGKRLLGRPTPTGEGNINMNIKIFKNRNKVTGEWRKLHNEKSDNLYTSSNIVRVIKSKGMRWAGHVTGMGEGRGVYRVLVGKREGKIPLGRPRRRLEDNIKIDLQEVECAGMGWIELAQDKDRWRELVTAVMRGIP